MGLISLLSCRWNLLHLLLILLITRQHESLLPPDGRRGDVISLNNNNLVLRDIFQPSDEKSLKTLCIFNKYLLLSNTCDNISCWMFFIIKRENEIYGDKSWIKTEGAEIWQLGFYLMKLAADMLLCYCLLLYYIQGFCRILHFKYF